MPYSRGATRAKCAKKRGQVVHLTNSFLMITLVKYTPLTVRKCMSARERAKHAYSKIYLSPA